MSRHGYRVLLSLFVICSSFTTVRSQIVEIDFDEVSAPGAFHQIFPGFDNGPTLEYPEITLEGCVILTHFVFGLSATSGVNICATCDTCTLGDDNPGPPTGLPGMVTGVFNENASSIDLDVINGFGGASGLFTLTAFDGGGSVAATDSVVAAPFESPGFVQHLSLSAPAIKSFTLTTGLPKGYTFAMDTLVFNEVPAVVPASGRVSSLLLDTFGDGQLRLRWDPSCLASDNDFAVYEGTFGDFSSHVPIFCSTAGALSKTHSPPAFDTYYLVVPRNTVHEGSHGEATAAERGVGPAVCASQAIQPCP